MHRICRAFAVSTLALTLTGSLAIAQEHPDDRDHHDDHHQQYVHHDDWKKGHRINHDDWNRGEEVDWHAHHLRRPPSGYEWRYVDGNYVLARPNDGLIFSVVIGH